MSNPETSSSTSHRATPQIVRVAVVQLAYLPAFQDSQDHLSEPLSHPERAISCLLPEGMQAAPQAISRPYKDLRKRLRASYVKQLKRRVEVVLEACKRWEVKVVVFPEYSIPPEILSDVAKMAPEIVVVAGSHFVTYKAIEEEYYEKLGHAYDEDLLENSASPILFDGKLLSLVKKVHPAKPEVGVMKPADEWKPVTLPDSMPGPMAVLICLDFLARGTKGHWEHIAPQFRDCSFVAAPALSPKHTLDEFMNLAQLDARRYKKPVLLANDAQFGGSTLIVDEGRIPDNRLYPEHSGLLEQREEGIIVADIDFGSRPPGPSTSFEVPPEIRPFAAASLVYRGIESKYAEWIGNVSAIIEAQGTSNFKKLKVFKTFANEHPPEIPKTESARQRRLSRLMSGIEDESKIERVRQWTREVLLPEDILPLSALRGALARGAADAIAEWQEKENLGEFGPVVKRLREAWEKEKKDTWTAKAHAAANAVRDEVAGDAKPTNPRTLLATIAAYEPIVGKQFEDAIREAVEFLQKEDFVEGKKRLEQIAADIDALINKGGSSGELLQQRARCQVFIGFATLNLQEMAQAREILLGVDPSILTEKARLQLISALVVVGEVERAKTLLPIKENVSQDALPTWAEATQSVMLGEGTIPDLLVPNEGLQLHAANVYLAQNNDKMAAQLALDVLQKGERPGLTREIATHVLYAALSRTVYDWPIAPNPPANRIDCKLEIREPMVQQLEESFRKLRDATLPEATRTHLLKLERAFGALIKDYDALAAFGDDALDDFEEDEPSHPNFADRDRAYELVRKGDVDEALRILPADPHPWRRRADEIDLLAHGRRFEQALEQAIALQNEFPDRPRIERSLAELYTIAKKHKASFAHARRAFVALPGIGYRLLLVQSMNNTGQLNEAFELLQDYLDDQRAQVQRMIGVTAMMLDKQEQAERAWKLYAEKKPNDWTALANLAQVQYRQHRLEDAAATSYLLFEKHGDKLAAEVMYQCGFHQATGLALESERKARITAITKKMHERFPKDVKAEKLRFQLLSKLGDIPADTAPIDFDALIKEGRGVRGFGFSTLIEQVKARKAFLDVVGEAARNGALPISTMLRIANNDPATFLTRLWDGFGPSERWLCPPISMRDEPPAAQLQDATILVGQLEFLLLLQLDLVGPLQKALAPNGRIALFKHVREQMLADAAMLRARRRPEKLEFVEKLIRKLERWKEAIPEETVPVIRWESSEPEVQVLRAQRGPFLPPHATLRFLRKTGVLTADELMRLERDLGLKGEPEPVFLEALPQQFAFCWSILDNLDEVGVLEKVQTAFPQQLVLEAGTLSHFREERNRLREEIAAAKLADSAHGLLAREQLQFLPAPSVNEVPRLRDDDSEYFEDIIRKPLREVVAYKKAELAESNRWRLTAEYFGTTNLGFPDTPRRLDWSNEQQYKGMMELVRRGTARDITFPSVVRYLVRNEKEADAKLRSLASLGFADALGPAELLRLDKQYEGLSGAEPKRLLDAMEWMTCHPQHLAGDEARSRIAHTYGAAVFNAFVATDRSEQESFRVLDQLFGRLERLGEETKTDPLDSAFVFLAGRTTDQWQSAWTPNEEKTYMHLDPDAAILRLWGAVHSWCQVNFVRRAALGRATRTLLSTVSQMKSGPPDAVARTLFALLPELTDVDKEISLIEPAHEAMGILSTFWETKVFAKTDPGDLIERSVEHFSARAMAPHGGRSARASVKFNDSDVSVHVAIPIEALFLRLSLNEKKNVVESIQFAQGPFDGGAYEFLERIKKHPEDPQVQREYALYATNALFRLVQDDPSYLARWQKGHWQDEQPMSPLVFLLMILSEPNAPLPAETRLFDILHARVMEESGKEPGVWAKRVDAGVLLRVAAEVPGVFPPAPVIRDRLQDPHYEKAVARALDRIDHVDDYPIARIAGDVYFLRVAASQKPRVSIAGQASDLRDILPGRLQMLLDRVIADPPPDTMAFFEPALLRVCGGVIQRLAFPDGTPIREGIFWTYRLFQWLCLQLEAIAPDTRLDGMRRLAAEAPPPNNPHDILDPFGFGRNDFDHRLATVLHTLANLHILDVPAGHDGTKSASPPPARVSSPEIEQRLLELAQKSHQTPSLGTLLDWHLPGNIPDIALYTLLNLNGARFADLSVESRLRRFEAIPKDMDALEEERMGERLLHELVLVAAANHAKSLSAEERKLVEAKVRDMADSPEVARYRWMIMISFFAAGENHLETEAFELVVQEPSDPAQGALLGELFLALADRDPMSLESIVTKVAKGLTDKGADTVLMIGGALARVLNMGKPESRKETRAFLLRLAKDEPFRDDTRMRELLATFNIRENRA